MARLKLIEMDSLNRMIYFLKNDKLIAFDADGAIELISDSLDGKCEPVRHGRWVSLKGGGFECSECKAHAPCMLEENYVFVGFRSDYCPNCGARMDEVDDD